ncbi:MAG: Sau3AI family type II restriction endonuclease, partial [candidate division SR1 bacterium]|nr:Sau3AI family type II restriction endonuclease [candidate division SR1 bacterium]
FMEIVDEERETSSFLQKNEKLLLFFYLCEEEKIFRDYIVEYINIRKFPPKDLLMIEHDWHTIQDKIKAGRAHELSEGDTFYLGACTKGKKGDNLRKQKGSPICAKQRAFSLKSSYLNTIIESFSKQEEEKESILKDPSILSKESFEEYIKNKFAAYIGLSPQQITEKLGVPLNIKSKGYLAKLARQVLGIKGNKIEEFEKANVTMKVMRLQLNGTPKESISFPAFKYNEIIEEDWEDSETLQMMDKKFFFVIFQYDKDGNLTLKKVMFWNIPFKDLDDDVRAVFNETKERILNGNINHLPKISESLVAHIRPHGKNAKDTVEAPDGKKYMKKAFWLNAKYIAKQIQ